MQLSNRMFLFLDLSLSIAYIRNNGARQKRPIQDISIELTNLDDSIIKINLELMKFYEEEDLKDIFK